MRLDTIVVGMDFSVPAKAAAEWIATHFAPNAKLILVHVIDPPPSPRFLRAELPTPPDDVQAAARDHAETGLRELTQLLPSPGVRTAIRVGNPFVELTEAAKAAGADLIVVGPHGDRPRPWKPLGTTAERVIRTSPVPVLIATRPPHGVPQRLLVAVDDASITPTVLRWARTMIRGFAANATLVHVLTRGEYSHQEVMAEVLAGADTAAAQRIEEKARALGTRWLEELGAATVGSDRVTAAVTFGRAGDAILAVAEHEGSDLILVGRTGAGAVRAALLGSTVSTVVHGARCPVLVVGDSEDYLT